MTDFEKGSQLTTSAVFYAAAGGVLKENYAVHRLVEVQDQGVVCCVFKKKEDASENQPETVVLYFPGKDNDNPLTSSDTTSSLNTIIERSHNALTYDEANDALHLMIVAESNRHMFFKVNHYVLAKYEKKLVNGNKLERITIIDSIKRDYNEEPIYRMIDHQFTPQTRVTAADDDDDFGVVSTPPDRNYIQRDWQSSVFDDWQCGYYVINEVITAVAANPVTSRLTVNDQLIADYKELHDSVVTALKPEKIEEYENAEGDLITFDDDKLDGGPKMK